MNSAAVLDRMELQKSLSKVRPAVLDQTFVPVLNAFCFTDTQVFAYNDIIGIAEKFPNSIGCAISSKVWGVVISLSGKGVSISRVGGNIRIKSGRTFLTVPVLEQEAYIFKPPTSKRKYSTALTITEELLRGFDLCLKFFVENYSLPVQRGIIVEVGDGEVLLYSTDNVTVSRYIVETETGGDDTTICLPAKFCELLVSRKEFVGEDLRIDKDAAWVVTSDSSIYSRQQEAGEYEMLTGLFEEEVEADQEITESLRSAAARAAHIARLGEERLVELSAGKNKDTTVFSASTSEGAIQEFVKMPPPEEIVRLSADTFAKSVGLCDRVTVTSDKLVFAKGEEFVHILSVMGAVDSDIEE